MIDPELITRKIVLITHDLDALGPRAAKDRNALSLDARNE